MQIAQNLRVARYASWLSLMLASTEFWDMVKKKMNYLVKSVIQKSKNCPSKTYNVNNQMTKKCKQTAEMCKQTKDVNKLMNKQLKCQ